MKVFALTALIFVLELTRFGLWGDANKALEMLQASTILDFVE